MSSSDPSKNGLSYADSGVNIDAGNALVDAIKPLIAATRRPGADGEIGGFGGVFDLKATGYNDPLLVAANDGVGTKLKIAIESGNHGTIGIDLVAMCVNDLIVQGAEPLFFLDYFATGKLDNAVAQQVISGIAAGCELAGCALTGGETAEMPGMYGDGDYDLAGFSVGAVEREALLPRTDMQAGDVLLAVASSGLHSNGFSLVRRIVEQSAARLDAPPPFDGGDRTLGECLLEPTRIYVKSILAAQQQTGAIKGLAHITGGGLTENLPRILPDHLGARIDLATWRPAPVFNWLREQGGVEEAEMLRTFNCGVGLVVVTDAKNAQAVAEALAAHGETVWQIGSLQSRTKVVVDFVNDLDWSEGA